MWRSGLPTVNQLVKQGCIVSHPLPPDSLEESSVARSAVKNRRVRPEDRVSLGAKLLYGSGGICFQFGRDAIVQLANPIYNIVLGVNPLLVGWVLTASRVWDAITDPIMGTISDNHRSRMGRRRPFVVAGAILSGITFPLMWFVSTDMSEMGAFYYFLLTAFFFYLAFTVFSVPYESLGYELTPDYNERTNIFGVRMFVSQVAMLLMPWLFRLTQADIFGDPVTGARWVGIFIGVLILVLGALPGFFMVERYRKLADAQEKRSFSEAIAAPLQNGPFMLIVSLVLMFAVGSSMASSLGIYVNIYYVTEGDTKQGAQLVGIFGVISTIGGVIGSLLVGKIAARFGKLRTLYGCIILCMIASLLKWPLFTPEAPYLQMIVAVILGPATAAFWSLNYSLKADICDYDEWKSGMRREGIYGAAAAWLHKAGSSLTYILSNAILVYTGYRQELGANQSEETLFLMRVFFTGLPVAVYIIALIVLQFYPLDDERAQQMRRDLEARRSSV